MRKNFFLFCLLLLCGTLLTTCNKQIPEGRLPDGYVAMTFDDSSVGQWYTNLPMMESLGIKATFYVSNYHALSSTDKHRLMEIQSRGHEIGYHTTNHKNLLKLLNEPDGWRKVNEEVNTDLLLMQQDGFVIADFAYPYGRHDPSLDRALLKKFKTVRVLTNKTNFYQSLATDTCSKQVLFAAHADVRTILSNTDLSNLLSKAKEKKACAILVAHQINDPNSHYQIDSDKLKFIADKAKEFNLQFITINQLH